MQIGSSHAQRVKHNSASSTSGSRQNETQHPKQNGQGSSTRARTTSSSSSSLYKSPTGTSANGGRFAGSSSRRHYSSSAAHSSASSTSRPHLPNYTLQSPSSRVHLSSQSSSIFSNHSSPKSPYQQYRFNPIPSHAMHQIKNNACLILRLIRNQLFKMRAILFLVIVGHAAWAALTHTRDQPYAKHNVILGDDGQVYFQKPHLDGYSPLDPSIQRSSNSFTGLLNLGGDQKYSSRDGVAPIRIPRDNGEAGQNSQNPSYQGEDPLDDLNLARQRTRTWIGAMSNLSPAALSRLKRELEAKVHIAIRKLNESTAVPDEAKLFRQSLLDMFLEELMESERDMRNAIDGLRRSLTSDFRNPSELAANAKHRLDFLKVATMKEEQSMNKLDQIATDFETYKNHINGSTSIMDELLKDVSKAADLLESAMKEHNEIALQGGNIEAVIHLHDDDEDEAELPDGYNLPEKAPAKPKSAAQTQYKEPKAFSVYGGILGGEEKPATPKEPEAKDVPAQEQGVDAGDILVDSQNNKYVLSKPKDTTTPLVNHHFASDIMLLLLVALPLGFLCHLVGLPCLFGYIMTGVLIGPSGFNQVEHVVQIETISEFGVFFIMFFAGLEFVPDRIRKVWKTAIQGPVFMMLIIVYIGCLIGRFITKEVPIATSAFTYACLSLSSTPLVIKFLQSSKDKDVSADSECGSLLLGMLVMQDVQLGLIIALLPALAKHVEKQGHEGGANGMSNAGTDMFSIFTLLAEILVSMALVFVVAVLLGRYAIQYIMKIIYHAPKEIQMLGSAGLMYIMLLFTNSMGLSMELGCFIAGIVIAISAGSYTEQVERTLEPVKDLFSTFFFTTIGFHVFPSFVAYEITILLWLTFLIVSVKFSVSALVLKAILPPSSQHIKWIISSGLAQISEFSFVLSSRARRLKIINREIYLLIISTTTFSLILAPVLWKLAVWKYIRNRGRLNQR